jgi:hypothetical protein
MMRLLFPIRLCKAAVTEHGIHSVPVTANRYVANNVASPEFNFHVKEIKYLMRATIIFSKLFI